MDEKTEVKVGKKRSLIIQYFTKDIYIEILRITMISSIDNNEKGMLIKKLLRDNNIPFSGLGPGTNRMAIQIDGYAVKIALDIDGMIDNKREMLYSKQLQPYVIKVYECIPTGLIAVTEYVEVFTKAEFYEYQDTMRDILGDISKQFLIGDVGVTGNNYLNWGIRNDGTVCILDFAYIYSVRYNVFVCNCGDDSLLQYDKNYVKLVCPVCGRVYTFGEIRRKITKKQQELEIGDIRRLGYNLTSSEQSVDINPEFEPKKKRKKKKSDEDKIRREQKKSTQNWDYPEIENIN